jgi:outer membrane lipoprotein-sorting protein
LNTLTKGKTSDVKSKQNTPGSALAFLSMKKDQLNANYLVVYIGKESLRDGTSTFHLQLTPKVKTSYKLADLWVTNDGFPQQAKVTENNNDSTTILFSNVQSNIQIQAAVFELKPKSSRN